MDFAIWITHSLREGLGELQGSKCVCVLVESAASKGGGLGGIYSPLEKTSHFIAVASIPDTSGMTYTTPTVTELQ